MTDHCDYTTDGWVKSTHLRVCEATARLKKIARERILFGDLPELSVQILELCRERGHVTISDIAKTAGASRNTMS